MSGTALHIYLNDHLAILQSEIEIAKRTSRENASSDLSTYLTTYVADCAENMSLIESLLVADGGSISHFKQAAGWLAEKAGRLKPNGALTGYTDLARVLELEVLISSARSRLALMDTLRVINFQNSALERIDWNHRVQQIDLQITRLVEFHRSAVDMAFQSAG